SQKVLCLGFPYLTDDVKTEYVSVKVSPDDSSSIELCAIEFFVKDDEWCEHPPENSIPNAQLEVSRNKGVLHCNEGFREKDGREDYATCENNTWSYQSLQCVETFCNSDVGNVRTLEGVWNSDSKSSKYSVGMKRTLKCKPGYNREGHPLTVTCDKNGTWTRTTATCKILRRDQRQQNDPKIHHHKSPKPERECSNPVDDHLSYNTANINRVPTEGISRTPKIVLALQFNEMVSLIFSRNSTTDKQ
ncbi:hypothetical protein AVEN_264627-1, partial [Araneus ventricosus]